MAVSASDSIADIVAALAEADALGLNSGDAAYANAVARRARLEEEAALVANLEAALVASDLAALSRHVAACLRLGIAAKHPGVLAKAKAKAAELGAQQQVLQHCVLVAHTAPLPQCSIPAALARRF